MAIPKHPGKMSLRWCTKVSEDCWKPTPEQYQLLLEQQPQEERQRIAKFLKEEDSNRSLMGRVLLQSAAALALNMEPGDIKFGRTKGKKPFIQEPEAAVRGLNANVSHHGSWVVLGMEEKGLVGVDVSATSPPRANMSADAFFKTMATSLSKSEWAAVRSAGKTDEELFHAFFVFWALKEAYTKAMGIGLALPFRRLELSVPSEILSSKHTKVSEPRRFAQDVHITASLDGRVKANWEFELYILDDEHLMAVAVGPHDLAVASYKAAMEELLAQHSAKKASSARRLSAADIRQSLVYCGNDQPVGFSIDVGSEEGCAINGATSFSALRSVAPQNVLPPALATRYCQAA